MRVFSKEELQKKFGYQQIGDFYESLACAEKNSKWFHIFPNGKPAYPEQYDLVEYFQGGMAWVKQGTIWFKINKKGEILNLKNTSSIL